MDRCMAQKKKKKKKDAGGRLGLDHILYVDKLVSTVWYANSGLARIPGIPFSPEGPFPGNFCCFAHGSASLLDAPPCLPGRFWPAALPGASGFVVC